MAIKGSCLCGQFQFELDQVCGPFEICHCNRCRKRSGSNGLAMVGAHADHYRVLTAAANTTTYSAPILNQPPAYHACFCTTCGSPLPDAEPTAAFEIPAGLFDEDPGIKPDKHIFTDLAASWDDIDDQIPQFTVRELVKMRRGINLPQEFHIRTHNGATHKL